MLTLSSPGAFQRLSTPRVHKASRDGAGVRERSHNRLQIMTGYQKTVAATFAFVGALFYVAALPPATSEPSPVGPSYFHGYRVG